MLVCYLLLVSGLAFAGIISKAPSIGPVEHSDRLLSLRRRVDTDSDSSVAVTGISISGFAPQARLEIRQLESKRDVWNIYLLGLRRFQAVNQTDRLSYYRIAAIHGRPYRAWDNVQGVYNEAGYCAHLSSLFLPWHRPYLALYEQVLFEHIIDAVNEFPTGPVRRRYASAALSWRMPYWDWAAQPEDGQSVYPSSLGNRTVVVTMPNGTRTIDNPLYSYKFHRLVRADMYFDPFAEWNETKRYPTGWVRSALSQEHLIGPVLDNNRVSIMNRLYNLFTYYSNYTLFATEAWQGETYANADSIESLHDTIHSLTGNNGHMTFLDYSAYDPIFWLHHANMDRIFAMWQILYPNLYVERMRAVSQTFTVSVGDVLDVDTPLEPFSSDTRGTKFTSKDVRSTLRFGYAYPETSGNASIAQVKRAINQLYGSSAGAGGPVKRAEQSTGHGSPSLQAPVESSERYYVANIVSPKFAMNGSYAVYIFLGDFEDTSSMWPLSKNLAGTHAVATNMISEHTANMRSATLSNIKVTGAVPLTGLLRSKVQSGELASLDSSVVEFYLSSNLKWRVTTFNSTAIACEDFTDLSVTVVSSKVLSSVAEDEFPQWGNFTKLNVSQEGQCGCK
ncbi:related to tyrosinase precursor (monophenol monooxygenase) [Ramularia collo-cygni]|uniref:tyrosinase n=1 Tax=Ramularia collo-cygni TaxID=112498 RepID=A0A2D3UP66_9PEZI|nr:related to tyrosinase precursor (monophenol monooxygenase) [Ramularia collo-cygni]CZT14535.1 related to tyrosinase precursor (monophenol monooxygenase) [Ramularia collo-cygni]